jgi:cell division protein FtsB
LKQNPKAVEKKAREKLWLVKPDEVVIIKKEK